MQREPKKNDGNNDEGLGRSRGGLSSKIHCVADGLGNPVDSILTGGEVHDSICAEALLDVKRQIMFWQTRHMIVTGFSIK
jgi:hypothetical protein